MARKTAQGLRCSALFLDSRWRISGKPRSLWLPLIVSNTTCIRVNQSQSKAIFWNWGLTVSSSCSVKCWNSGKLLVCQNPRESDANERWGIVPLKHKIRLPKPVEAHTARALVTLHGQLYISVAYQKGAPRKVPGTSKSKAQDEGKKLFASYSQG